MAATLCSGSAGSLSKSRNSRMLNLASLVFGGRIPEKTARMTLHNKLMDIYRSLDERFGDLHWWPADDPFEVMAGAILTQNTSWANVEKALSKLKVRNVLCPDGIMGLTNEQLAELIRPSGYYNLKAERLRSFTRFFIDAYSGSVERMRSETLTVLRPQLLGVRGVGRETADSILLYACEKPIFVIDAYTRRLLLRHGIISGTPDYESMQSVFMNNLPHKTDFFKQFHALIVNNCKVFCKKTPDCRDCPLAETDRLHKRKERCNAME